MDGDDAKLKEVGIKNWTCSHFDGQIKIELFNLDNVLRDEKSFENILVYNISNKNLIANPLRIRFGKVDGFIRTYDGTKSLVSYGSKKYDSIYNRNR